MFKRTSGPQNSQRRTSSVGRSALTVVALLSAACSSLEFPQSEAGSAGPSARDTGGAPPDPLSVLAFGDVSDCRGFDRNVASLVAERPEAQVLMVGDTAYPDGSQAAFDGCFTPLYGDDLHRIHAVPGDNDYDETTGTADAFFSTLGSAAGAEAEGWTVFEGGGWMLVGLNTNCNQVGGCDPLSPQYEWLDATLHGFEGDCILAYMHEPRFTSASNYQGIPRLGDFYQLLFDFGADLLLVGNSHHYERFERLGIGGLPTPEGIVNITIGTGGAPLTSFGEPLPGSMIRSNDSYGALSLELRHDGFSWEFLTANDDATLVDAGSDTC